MLFYVINGNSEVVYPAGVLTGMLTDAQSSSVWKTYYDAFVITDISVSTLSYKMLFY